MATDVIFVIMMFIEHLMQSTWEVKKHLENEKENEQIIQEWFFGKPIENKIKKIYNPKPLKQIVWDNIKLDKQLKKTS